jgi:hypothetical protein
LARQYPFETIGDAQTRYDLVTAAKEQAEEESAARMKWTPDLGPPVKV